MKGVTRLQWEGNGGHGAGGFRQKSQLLLLENSERHRDHYVKNDFGWTSRGREVVPGLKCCRGGNIIGEMMEIREDLGLLRPLTEMDDMVTSTVVDGRLDTYQHLDGDQFFYHYRCPPLFHLSAPTDGNHKSGVSRMSWILLDVWTWRDLLDLSGDCMVGRELAHQLIWLFRIL